MKQTGAQIFSAKYNVGADGPEFDLRMVNSTLNEVVAIAKDCRATKLSKMWYPASLQTGVIASTDSPSESQAQFAKMDFA